MTRDPIAKDIRRILGLAVGLAYVLQLLVFLLLARLVPDRSVIVFFDLFNEYDFELGMTVAFVAYLFWAIVAEALD